MPAGGLAGAVAVAVGAAVAGDNMDGANAQQVGAFVANKPFQLLLGIHRKGVICLAWLHSVAPLGHSSV
jgi:hypothetical protein